jgi:hypothetical protein
MGLLIDIAYHRLVGLQLPEAPKGFAQVVVVGPPAKMARIEAP